MKLHCRCNLFKARRLLYVRPGLTIRNSTWCPHCVYVFCTDLRTNSDLYNINRSVLYNRDRVFTARYALSPFIKQTRFVFKWCHSIKRYKLLCVNNSVWWTRLFEEHVNFRSDIRGYSCNLRYASASSLFLYLVFVIPYGENPDSQR